LSLRYTNRVLKVPAGYLATAGLVSGISQSCFAPARMKRLREDPLSPVLELNPDLQAALARLAEKLK